jgi:hypothetical protein
MKPKTIKTPQSVSQELTGFEDILDLLPGHKLKVSATDNSKKIESTEFVSYIEIESKRMQTIIDTLTEKRKAIEEHSQIPKIEEQQNADKVKLYQKIVEQSLKGGSPFLNNMDHLWKLLFDS